MGIYGQDNVKIDLLKQWAESLDIENIVRKSLGGYMGEFCTEETNRLYVQSFLKFIKDLEEGDYWMEFQNYINEPLLPALFCVSNNAIRVANYYEILIVPANGQTEKKIIKGYDYLDVGEIHLYDGDTCYASIGLKSDLIWSCLYHYFIHEDIYGTSHTIAQHDRIMSLQLFDIWGKSQEEINSIVNNILFKCSVEKGLDFKIYYLDDSVRSVGELGHFEIRTEFKLYDSVPLLYYNNGIALKDIRMKYLAFYQAIEYYFEHARNNYFLKKISDIEKESPKIDHHKLTILLKDIEKSHKELDSLNLVLKQSIDISTFKKWVTSDEHYLQWYVNNEDTRFNIDILAPDDKIIKRISKRIYTFRCAIAHSKADTSKYVAIPFESDEQISKEISLIKWVSTNVIIACRGW